MQQETNHKNETQSQNRPTDIFSSGKLTGVMMIAIGAIYMLGMSGIDLMGFSPWILMTLIPVLWAGRYAFRTIRRTGRLTGKVVAIAAASTVPMFFVAAQMMGYNVAALWPLGIIGVGVAFIAFGNDWRKSWNM